MSWACVAYISLACFKSKHLIGSMVLKEYILYYNWLVAWWVVSPEVLRQEVVEVMIMLLLLLAIMNLIVMSNVQLSITEPITEEAGLVTQQGRQHRYPHTCNSSNIDNQVRKPSGTLSSSHTEPVVKDLNWKIIIIVYLRLKSSSLLNELKRKMDYSSLSVLGIFKEF